MFLVEVMVSGRWVWVTKTPSAEIRDAAVKRRQARGEYVRWRIV